MPTTSTWLAFRQPSFRILWIVSLLSGCFVSAHDTAAIWLMSRLGASSLQLSLMSTAAALPFFLFALPAGSVADAVDRKQMLTFTNFWLALSAASLAVIGWLGRINPIFVLGGVFMIGVGFAFNAPTYAAATMDLVGKEQISSAVTLGGVQMNLSNIAGPAIGGALVSVIGPYAIFTVNSICFLLVAAVILTLQRRFCRLPLERFAESMIGAVRYVRYTPGVQIVLLRNLIFAVFISAIPSLMPVIALKELELGSGALGLVFTFMGIGSVFCAVVLLPYGRAKLSPNILTLTANGLLCVVFVLMAIVRSPTALFGVATLAGTAWTLAASELWVAAQRSMPEWARARLNATHMVVSQGGMALGGICWGLLVGLSNAEAAFLAAACALLIVSLFLRPLSIDFTESLDFEPSPLPTRFHRFPRFPKPEDGPVVISLDYVVAEENRGDFLKAMGEVRGLMLRNGATSWQLEEDLEKPNCFRMEMLVSSWSEHLRQHNRITRLEKQAWERAASYHLGEKPVKTKHFLSVDRDVLLSSQREWSRAPSPSVLSPK